MATLATKEGIVAQRQAMQTLSARDAKYGFGRLIDLARAEPVMVAKHGRPVIVVLAIEEYERLKALADNADQKATPSKSRDSRSNDR